MSHDHAKRERVLNQGPHQKNARTDNTANTTGQWTVNDRRGTEAEVMNGEKNYNHTIPRLK